MSARKPEDDVVTPENTAKDAQAQSQKAAAKGGKADDNGLLPNGLTKEENELHEAARADALDPEKLGDINNPPGTSLV
jgi:hypothetical protein